MENKEDSVFRTYKPKLSKFGWWIEFSKICTFCVIIVSSNKMIVFSFLIPFFQSSCTGISKGRDGQRDRLTRRTKQTMKMISVS